MWIGTLQWKLPCSRTGHKLEDNIKMYFRSIRCKVVKWIQMQLYTVGKGFLEHKDETHDSIKRV
jgi:hypothetical protein